MGEAPTVASAPDDDPDDEPDVEEIEADAQPESSADVEESTVDLSDDDLGGSSLFSGVEDSESTSSSSSADADDQDDDQDDGDDDGDEPDAEGLVDGLDGNAGAMEDAINGGVARALVTGITDDDFGEESTMDKKALQEELEETAEAFRLGYFGSQVVDEYFLAPDGEEPSPAWGLAGACLMMLGMAVWLRPDGDEAVERLRGAVGDLSGVMPT